MSEIRVRRAKQIAAEIRVPGDKNISHRAVMLAGLANGPCEITGFLPSEDCLATVRAMEALGAKIEYLDADPEDEETPFRPTHLRVHGTHMKPTAPKAQIDCGSSVTSLRLLTGILAAQPFDSVITGDNSLSTRPMDKVIDPLSAMGAKITPTGDWQAPLTIRGSGDLKAIDYDSPVASSQVKSAVLLAGMFAQGRTTISEPAPTRDHTERMLNQLQVKTTTVGSSIAVYGDQMPESQEIFVPGDISSAAYWLVAAAAQSGANLNIHGVGLNPTRTGILKVLIHMGAHLTDVQNSGGQGEPNGSITVRGSSLRGIKIGGEIIANLIDELPIIAVAGALAGGTTVIRDAANLRGEATDRISAVANNLRAFGVEVKENYDGMTINGGSRLRGARVGSFGDHRIAMAFAIAGLHAEGETVIEDCDCIASAYPNFEEHLKEFQSHRITGDGTTPVITSLQGSRTAKRKLKGGPNLQETDEPHFDD